MIAGFRPECVELRGDTDRASAQVRAPLPYDVPVRPSVSAFVGVIVDDAPRDAGQRSIAVLRELQRVAPNVFNDFTITALPDGSEVAASPYAWES